MSVARTVSRWAGLKAARRVAKSLPFVGTAVAVFLVAEAVKRKGWIGGVVHTGLDALPVVGTLKNGIELFTDDWIPDLPPSERVLEATAVPVPGVEAAAGPISRRRS
jgi:hypothetical protein